ncbi:hypothetical protein CLUG_02030 [Clavispora lusitaniae ATCC 42720]|uniref:Zn(2)-C6 fungal-type domain-containing protein n=1 Tax=Clavispora lusitaniae (strain ATCC 42720) TaxID=306902 RepID=C4Y1E8_CLAL4|nr:uncharacterized protein CLUG_02030 [Clavispora lusitaniae ATCC 42720]EEQ37905.1 hypothetical protein CLUG_02030 [Clavispora lusitaniae ATCC 42720]
MDTEIPALRTRKRRLVPPEKRKKAAFSCDRCKVRKIACVRPGSGACANCARTSAACETTLPRKKRIRGPVKNIALHYKCLYELVRAQHPEVDANNIDALIGLGESLGVAMPRGESDDEALALRITRGRSERVQAASPQLQSLAPPSLAPPSLVPQLQSSVSPSQALPPVSSPVPAVSAAPVVPGPPFSAPSVPYDPAIALRSFEDEQTSPILERVPHVLFDGAGNPHLVGPWGSSWMLKSFLQVVARKARAKISQWPTFRAIHQAGLIVSSQQPPSELADARLAEWPRLVSLGRPAADRYAERFFRRIHPRFVCFSRADFDADNARFWAGEACSAESGQAESGSRAAVCSLYMVWILGRMDAQADATEITETPKTEENGPKTDENDPKTEPANTSTEPANTSTEPANTSTEPAEPESLGPLAPYLRIVRACVADIALTPTLPGVRCLLLLALYMDSIMRRETAYSLVGLAARHALSLGLHRSTGNVPEARVWWTLFVYETALSSQMGRAPCLGAENCAYPWCSDVGDAGFARAHAVKLDLARVAHEALVARPESVFDAPLSAPAVARFALFERRLSAVFCPTAGALPENSRTALDVALYFHNCRMSLLGPVVLHAANTPDSVSAAAADLVGRCLESCVAVAHMAQQAVDHGFFGPVPTAIFALFSSCMGLVLFLLVDSGAASFSRADVDAAVECLRGLKVPEPMRRRPFMAKSLKYKDLFLAVYDHLQVQSEPGFDLPDWDNMFGDFFWIFE